MKNTLFLSALMGLAIGTNAQNTTTTTTTETSTSTQAAGTVITPDPSVTKAPVHYYQSQNATVDSISAKYKLLPMPGALTLEKAFPVLGSYQLSGENAATVSITPDSVSKGIVWINGLPQGTVKAYLAKSPATYRIISQKTASGKQVPEGTLVFSPETNTLNIALGAPYNSENPTAIFPVVATATEATVATPSTASTTTVKVKKANATGKSKQKNKVIFYTATKANALTNTGSNAAFGQQLEQAAQHQ